MKIELLYLEGCPNVGATLDRLTAALEESGLSLTISKISVEDERAAEGLRFLGSPTIRINGLDIDPSARQRTTFGMMCRTYENSGGVPPRELIWKAITRAAASST